MRMRIVFGIIFSVWVLLLVRVYYLSVKSNDFYEEIAEQNAVKTQYLAPVRGLILDAKGRPMAVNRLGFSVALKPHLSGKRAEILDAELANLQNLFEDLNVTKLKREYVKADSPYNQDFIQIIDFMDYDKMIPRIAGIQAPLSLCKFSLAHHRLRRPRKPARRRVRSRRKANQSHG